MARRGAAPHHRPVSPSLAAGAAVRAAGPAIAARPPHPAPLRLEPLPLLVGAPPIDVAEAFRDLPGTRTARERPTRPQRALDVPDRGSGRGPRTGLPPAAIRSRSPARLLARSADAVARPRGDATAVPRRPGRVPRLRAGRALRAPRRAAGRTTRPAAPPPRAPRLGDRLGPPDRRGVARRSGARRRRRRSSTGGCAEVQARLDALLFARLPSRAESATSPTLTLSLEPSPQRGLRGRCRGRSRRGSPGATSTRRT